MAYIKSETVKEMRNEIKSLFPAKKGWKISVTCENYSRVNCTILEAPIQLLHNTERTHESVNHFWIREFYKNNPEAVEIFEKIKEILNRNNYNKYDSQTDYFDVGHHIEIALGRWDKPFKVN